VLLGTVITVGGCGSSAKTTTHAATTTRAAAATSTRAAAPVCKPVATAIFGAAVHVSAGHVAAKVSMGNNGMPQCGLEAGKVVALVNVDNGPQPYARLERTAEEASQPFTQQRLSPSPIDLKGLGLDADWFPEEQQLMTTDGNVLLTVTITWPRAKQAKEIALAKRLARPYLGKLNGKGAHGEV
jgi:hypothetical protein